MEKVTTENVNDVEQNKYEEDRDIRILQGSDMGKIVVKYGYCNHCPSIAIQGIKVGCLLTGVEIESTNAGFPKFCPLNEIEQNHVLQSRMAKFEKEMHL